MDILQAVLIFGAVLSPLVAAGAIAAVSLFERSRAVASVRIAQLGSATSACCALGVLFRRAGSDLSGEAPLILGSWSIDGLDLLRINFALRIDAPTAALIAVLAFSTCCLFAAWRPRQDRSTATRWTPLAGSLLLFLSIGVAASTNLVELFVFWEVATAVVYVISALSAQNALESNAARKLALVLSVGDALLLCAAFLLLDSFKTLDFRILFGRPELWARAAAQQAGRVDFVGLCLLGAFVARCGMVPFLGWIGDLRERPAPLAALIEAIALLPCGAILLIRCLPLLLSAGPILPLVAFVAGSSAFCLAVCAGAAADFRRAARFACASVLATLLLGLSTGEPASRPIALGVLIVFVPASTALLLGVATHARPAGRVGLLLAMVSLFSGLCGQAWLLGGALHSLFAGPGADKPPLLLAVLLAGCGQYLAAFSVARSFGRIGLIAPAERHGFDGDSAMPIVETQSEGELSAGPQILLGCAAVTVTLGVGIADYLIFPDGHPTRNLLAFAGLGLIPGIGGLIAGGQATAGEWTVFPGEAANGLLVRLGRGSFYFDAFLFLFVLVPLRGVAGVARFIDWAVIDTLASGGPASVLESAASFFGPLQKRGVGFYLFSATLGTVVLSLLLIWLRG
jgi:NADH:ubiquinone oxidoreductase subunit 5 (subunit L)/multisubunit Na+/H+ antiporter MnhA subunit